MDHRFEFFALRTLRGKFLALIVPFFLLSMIVVFGISELGARHQADRKLRAKLDELVEIQSAVLWEPLWTVNNNQVELVLTAIAIDPDVLGAIAYDESNNPVASVGAVEALERQEFFAKRAISHGARDDRKVIGHLALALTNARIRAESGTRLLVVVGLGALLLLSVVIIALVANRRTIGIPLEQLLQSINQSRESGERVPVDWTSRDEIGEVVTAFNEMQTRQQAYETELHEARDDLELRVEKRSKELAESRLRHAQKMEILGQLSSSVAHDFNNVLTVLDCNIGLLKSQNSGQGQQDGLINNCLEAVVMGSNLTSRLTDFARKEPVANTRIDLNTSIAGFSDLLKISVGKDVSVEFILTDDALPVLADAVLVEVALLNLAMNAHDAMPEGGKITVRTDKTIIDKTGDPLRSKDAQRPYALLQVSDTGTGMPPEIKERALEAFFTTKDEGKGTGLGLRTVQDLAQSTGGFVEIESELKKGTTVKIYLPLHESDNGEGFGGGT